MIDAGHSKKYDQIRTWVGKAISKVKDLSGNVSEMQKNEVTKVDDTN